MSGGAVVASLASSAFWLACGSDDTSAVTCTGDSCVADAGLTDTSDDEQHVPDGCDLTKDPKDSAACVDDTIGLFVSSTGSDANPGTKEAPLKTIGAAVGKTDSLHTRVYVCAGAYGENVKVATGNKTQGIYAGFSCGDWSYAGGAPNAIVTSNGGYALEVNTLNTTLTVEDVELDSPDATNPGDSSIAVFITTSTGVILKRVNAKAGKGADGADAVATSNWDADPDGGVLGGHPGSGFTGGASKECACKDSTHSIGGQGGDSNLAGADGGPSMPANPDSAHDGLGGPSGSLCFSHPGAFGAAGDAGALGATNSGTLKESGWTTTQAALGATGAVAQGGGGGGGNVPTGTGAGGGGGCGGCGGAGGSAGASGGSSIALTIYQSTVTLDTCAATAGAGGAGKNGGTAQTGQVGGYGGASAQTSAGCAGGQGGTGGAGAGGGGGAAGNSIALGYLGTAPTVQSSTFTKGSAGTPGGGGTGAAGNNGLAGADGISAEQQDLKP